MLIRTLGEQSRRDPDDARSALGLAWILATHPDPLLRDPDEAIRVARLAAEVSGADPITALDVLAAAYAAAGRFGEASASANGALALAGRGPRAEGIRERLGTYALRKPYTEPVAETGP
jgi:spermidine synthase